jgi:branched-chain amino acid transport system substrate-binding protein
MSKMEPRNVVNRISVVGRARAWLLLALIVLIFPGCGIRPAVKVGFSAEISGKQSELGVQLRNGVQMAVDEVNAAGGIDGRKITLIVEDDLGTVVGAQEADQKLIDAGVTAIVGHFTSNQTMAGYSVTETHGMVMFSATASTSALSAKKDHFFRTVASTEYLGEGMANYIRNVRKLDRIAILYDKDNNLYSVPMTRSFVDTFSKMGGQVLDQISYAGGQAPDFNPLVENLKKLDPQGVLIIASPLNAALISQSIALQNWRPALFAASWAQGEGLIQNGGRSVEGMETIIGYDTNDPSPALKTFKENYEKRFGHAAVFSAMEGYETMQMLAEALKVTRGSAIGLSEALINIKNFQGLTGPIYMDEYGDATRTLYIQRVNQKKFETIEQIVPQP